MAVFVLDRSGRPLMPCTEKRARLLLERGRARVHKMLPFTKGKKTGSYTGRVAVRASGSFNIQTSSGLVQGVFYRDCTVVQRGDGYGYQLVAKTDVTGTPPKQGMLRIPRSTSPACLTRGPCEG